MTQGPPGHVPVSLTTCSVLGSGICGSRATCCLQLGPRLSVLPGLMMALRASQHQVQTSSGSHEPHHWGRGQRCPAA